MDVEKVFLEMHPFRLMQYIVVWYCICHLIIVILLKAVIFIWGWIRPVREKMGTSVKS